MTSNSSIEPGAEIAGFRIERRIGGRVYAATQRSLDRPVALKLLPLGAQVERFAEHPDVVGVYAAGTTDDCAYVAMRLVHGRTLAEARVGRRRMAELLATVAGALDDVHAQGIAHGAVSARNVFVENGRALLSEFGSADATPAGDRAAFGALVHERLGVEAAPAQTATAMLASVRVRDRRVWGLVAALALAACGTAALLVARDGHDVPPPLPGATVLGSALAGAAESVDCEGHRASGASLGCTILQTRLEGRRVAPPRDGVIRRWTVRGASGELGLIVLRGDALVPVARTPSERVTGTGVHSFDAELPVREGDVVALDVAPGATIGVRRRDGASTARWIGPLTVRPRAIDFGPGTGFDRELLLRLELVPGSVAARRSLAGAAAAAAPAGERLAAQPVDVPGDRVRTLVVVRVGGAVVVDLFDGRRRIARAPFPDADPGGQPLGITVVSGTVPTVRWRDPDGSTVTHSYLVGARTLTLRV